MPLLPWISQQLAAKNGSESGFRELCERVPVGIFLADLADQCVYANPAACAIIGVTADEAVKHGWTRHLHPDDRARTFAAWEAAVAAEAEFLVECRYEVPQRGLVWARLHAVPWRSAAGEVAGYLGSIEDITLEQRAEQSLAEQERLFRTIFEQAGMGVAVLDSRTGQFLRVNQKFCDLVGYTSEEMLQRTFQSLTHPDDVVNNERVLNDMLAGTRHNFALEKRYIRKDGATVWVHLTITPLWKPGEPPDRHITIVEDITEPKLADERLRESEERFRRLCDHAPVGIFLADAGGATIYTNARCGEIIGLSPSQAQGQGWGARLHPDQQARVRQRWHKAVAAGRPYRGASRYVHADGSVRQTTTTAIPLRDAGGSVTSWIGVMLDVTEERQALEALRASEEQYRELFHANTDGLLFISLAGRVVDVNRAACRMHGYTREEFLQLDPHVFIHPDSHHQFIEFLETCRAGEVFHCEAKDMRKDGTVFDIDVYGTRLVYRGELHAFAILRDIGERKTAEAKLRRQEAMLAHVSRLSTMGEMVAGIAHEVNQPLYSIVNFAKAAGNVLAQNGAANLDDLRAWNEEIAAAATRAGDIVRRLRDFTRRSPAAQADADLQEIIRESLELVQPELRRAEVEVRLELAGDLPPVQVDGVQIQQVVVNLMKNAIEAFDAAPPAGRRVQITTRREGEHVRVAIADNGPGLAQLAGGGPFEPFVTSKPEGMGLGLAISRTIIEAHGGTIAAKNNPDAGATFTFFLPLPHSPV